MNSESKRLTQQLRDLKRENIALKEKIGALEAESRRRTKMLDDLERDVLAIRGRS